MIEITLDLLLIIGLYTGFVMIFEGFVRIFTKDAIVPAKQVIDETPTQDCSQEYTQARPAKKRGRPKGSKNRKTLRHTGQI